MSNQQNGKPAEYRWRLREILDEQGIRQEELARRLGVTRPMVGYLCRQTEKGHGTGYVVRLCAALGVTPNDLIGMGPTPKGRRLRS